MLGTIFLVVVILLLIGAMPNWGYHPYGWRAPGVIGVLLIVLLILILTGRL